MGNRQSCEGSQENILAFTVFKFCCVNNVWLRRQCRGFLRQGAQADEIERIVDCRNGAGLHTDLIHNFIAQRLRYGYDVLTPVDAAKFKLPAPAPYRPFEPCSAPEFAL